MIEPTKRKSELPDDHYQLPEAPDEFSIVEGNSEPPRISQEQMPEIADDEPRSDNEDRQFTLGELFVLMALLSIAMSILTSVARWMGWANSPASLAAVFALAFGLGTFVGIFYMAFSYNARPIARVGLWVLIGGYMLCAACAAFLPK